MTQGHKPKNEDSLQKIEKPKINIKENNKKIIKKFKITKKSQIISSQRAYLHLIVANLDETGSRVKLPKDYSISSRYSPSPRCIPSNMQILSAVKCKESARF